MTAERRVPKPKQMPTRMILAQQGINLIERVVLEMKCRWHPTVGVDAGIDGTVELTDQADEPHPLDATLAELLRQDP